MTKYPLILRIFHWVMALMMVGMLAAGIVMTDFMAPSDSKWFVYGIHKSIGITILGLVFLRMCIRLVSSTPSLPHTVKWYESFLAKGVYLALYGLMIAIPTTGYLMSVAGGHDVAWFGILLPNLIEKSADLGKLMKEYHTLLAFTVMGFITLHFVGFLKHYIFDKENLLKRM